MKLILSIFLIFTLSCTKKENFDEKVLNLYHNSKVKGYDPAFASDRYSGEEVARIYEGLLQYHYLKRPYTLIPNLAEKMPVVSKDGLTYTFTIKKNIYFHDDKCFENGKGRELVAEDFVYAIKRIADPKLQADGWWLLDNKIVGLNEWREQQSKLKTVNYDITIEGIKSINKYSLQFKLKRPFPQFLYALAMPYTFATPREAVEFYKQEFLNHPVGTGAFVLNEFTQGNKIIYTRNPNFRDKFYPKEGEEGDKELGFLDAAGKKLPFVDKVIVHLIIEDQTRWLNFNKGKVDYLSIPKDNFGSAVTPSNEITKEMQKKGFILDIEPSLDVTYTAFNNDDPIFKNKKLRQAMSLAYNSNEANKLFYGGKALKAESIIPPGIAGNIENFKNPYRSYNVEKAKKLLAEAGYPGGKGLPTFQFEILSSSWERQSGEYFTKSMKKIGINIVTNANTWPELTKKVTTKQAQIYAMAWNADYPDAENFFQLLYSKNKSPGSNGCNYDNPEFDKIFEKASILQDGPERTKLYEELNKIVAEDVPWIFGVHRMRYYLKQPWFKNFKITEFEQHREQYMDIDQEVKKEFINKL